MGKKLVLKNVRFTWVRVFEPRDAFNSGKARYEITLLLPKTDKELVNKVRKALKDLQDEYVAEHPKFVVPKTGAAGEKWNPIKDGDDSAYSEEFGYFKISAYRKEEDGQPLVIDKFKQPITRKEDIYSGSWGVASIDAYVYDNAGGKGITFGLNGVQKVKDDEAFGGGAGNVEDDFDDESGMDDDPIFG